MCRSAVALLAIASLWGSPPAHAQGGRERDRRTQALLTKAKTLLAEAVRADSTARQDVARRRRARLFVSGELALLLPGTASEAAGRTIIADAAGYLDEFGAVPVHFVASHIVVSVVATAVDSVLRASGMMRRAPVPLDLADAPDTLVAGWIVAVALGRAFRTSLDSTWRAWLPPDLSIGWRMRRDDPAAVRELMEAQTRVAARCLGGELTDCGRWLGVDRDLHPFRTRFEPADIRRLIRGRSWFYQPGYALASQCITGSDDACVRIAEQGDVLDPIPAGRLPRSSLLRAVRARHGLDALRQALADTVGSVGERLARAAGVGRDSMLAEWRAWVMTGGGQRGVTASAGDTLPSLLVVGLLLFAAARSGRWR
jgi:hypothetical protein